MSTQHQVDVHVPQARHNTHSVGGDNLRPGRNCYLPPRACRDNAFTVDDDHGIANRRSAVAVNKCATRDCVGAGQLSVESGRCGEQKRETHPITLLQFVVGRTQEVQQIRSQHMFLA